MVLERKEERKKTILTVRAAGTITDSFTELPNKILYVNKTTATCRRLQMIHGRDRDPVRQPEATENIGTTQPAVKEDANCRNGRANIK